jgi:site-specific DNA recombinase
VRELEAERKMLCERCEAAKEADNVIALHPKAIDHYKRVVMQLADELKRGTPTEFASIRELVTAIVVHASPSRPGGAGTKADAEDDRSVRVDIKGRLAQLCDNSALFPNIRLTRPL